MPTYSEKRLLPFTPDEMFDLIMGVEHYPEFLPWCVATRINSKSDNQTSGEMSADMAIGFKSFRETYTSKITFEKPSVENPGHIHVVDSNGPFKRLETDWIFTQADVGSEVEFNIDFEFRSKMMETLIGKVFNDATKRMVDAFVARGEKLYGKSS
ncbi:MAG: type II toxin-antitoxin system RatA family toxin [Rhodospirillaceae bacterium]|nr:type II toxin-antitoxin system RatA family toxin [Rhodospirillaceae bacterium]